MVPSREKGRHTTKGRATPELCLFLELISTLFPTKWGALHRFSIPNFVIDPETGEKELWAVQYRIRPLLYCLVVEGVLDCITLRRFGVPAVSTFQGNDTARTWNLDSNKSVRGITGILVVPDNDGLNGDVIALSKLNDIPRSSPLRLPDEFKDAGKMIEKYLPLGEDAVREALDKWLYPRPLIGDL